MMVTTLDLTAQHILLDVYENIIFHYMANLANSPVTLYENIVTCSG